MRHFCIMGAFLFFLTTNIAKAHNPYEVSYFFKYEQKELVIHLTPQTVVDLLQHLNEELADQSMIVISDYHAELSAYLKSTIHFYVNGEPIGLTFKNAALTQHDATIRFSLEHLKESLERYTIEIISFTEVYTPIKNYVNIQYGDKKIRHILNRGNISAKGNINTIDERLTTKKVNLLSISGFVILTGLIWAVHRKKPKWLKPF
ncbi:DUF6702 family protein [Allomuricauda sp. SCSIO 65647]|uniref:DUF6702 family protein n=1 Tax=Allomuricauda sp. SCSIO 65647 TaxID=2908843 RepID=UPI001F3D7CC8|nr:DUF6702 family protein [Muricauda sp. SCSIO 65647]UJH67708.1 hypothetical protein L0P89_00470 [Muricauda sp. SCSIO 65647]